MPEVSASLPVRTEPYQPRNLLFLHDVLLDGSQRGVVALLEPAGGQVPLVLLFQADVLLAEVRHLVLELIDPDPLLLQKPLLGLYDLVQLLQILRRLAGVLRRVLHLVKSPLAVHGGDIIPHKRAERSKAAGRSRRKRGEMRRGGSSERDRRREPRPLAPAFSPPRSHTRAHIELSSALGALSGGKRAGCQRRLGSLLLRAVMAVGGGGGGFAVELARGLVASLRSCFSST